MPAPHDGSWLVTRLSALIPARWRQAVIRDLAEEAERTGQRRPTSWVVRHLLAIAIRLRWRTVSDRLPARQGLLTGFLTGDLRGVGRHLRRSPSTTLISVLTLAIAVAAVLTVFAVLNRTVLRPLDFGSDRLTAVWRVDPASPNNWLAVAAGDVVDWRRDATAFDSLVAARNISMTFTGFEDGGAPLMRRVTHNWFETLGVTPVLGRTFSRDEDVPNGPPVAMLSYNTWQNRFAGRPDVLGQTVELDNVAFSIVGVTPQSYFNPVFGVVDEPEAFLPLGLADAGESRGTNNLLVIGRLREGANLERAQSEILGLTEAQAVAFPQTNRQFRATVQPLDEQLVRPLRTPLALLFVAVLGLFVAACGNVANLQLARALGRRQEHVVQQALGASRLRLLLQMLTEGLALATLAGATAVWLTAIAGPAVQSLMPAGFLAPRVTFALDGRALAMAALITVMAALLSSIPAMLSVLRRVDGTELGAGAVKAIGGRERRRWASALVAIEMAIAVTLLTGAGLALLGFEQMRARPHGFTPEGAITFRVSTRGPEFETPQARLVFFERVREELAQLPGVTAVGQANALPVFSQFGERAMYAADVAAPPPEQQPRIAVINVGGDLLGALGMPLISGRAISPDDRMDHPPVAMLSQSAARQLFGNEDPTGRPLTLVEGSRTRQLEVVGVVGDVRSSSDPSTMGTVAYLSWQQVSPPNAMGFVVRSPEAPATLTRMSEQAVHRVNRAMPLYVPRALTDIAASLESTYRFTATLLTVFATLGLLLVATGIYGTISHLVADRRRELGVRVALGATRSNVLALVLREGLRPATAGLALGSVAALIFGQLIALAVAGTPAFAWSLFLGLPAVLLGVGVLASFVPAVRATRVDPTTALRAE